MNSSEITRNEGRPWRALEQGPWRVPRNDVERSLSIVSLVD